MPNEIKRGKTRNDARIVVGGCSLTAGYDLSSSLYSWEHQLVAGPNTTLHNVAHKGIGNLQIAHRVIDAVGTHGGPSNCAVMVMWTFTPRYDFIMRKLMRESNDPWYTITPHHVFPNPDDKLFTKEHIERANEAGIPRFAGDFLAITSPSNEVHHSLWQVLTLQNFLKVNDIPYMFTFADAWFVDPTYLKDCDREVMTILNMLDRSRFFLFPHDQGPCGFHRWAHANGYCSENRHPVEEAHTAAAELMRDRYSVLVKEFHQKCHERVSLSETVEGTQTSRSVYI